MNTYDYIDPNYLHDNEGGDESGVTEERREEANSLANIAQWLFVGALFVLPFIFIPIAGWSVAVGKMVLVSLLGLSAGALAFGSAANRSITLPKVFTFSFLGILVLLVLSTFLGSPTSTSIFGANLEVGTFFTTAVAVMLALMAPVILTDRKKLALSLMAILASSVIVVVFHLLRLFVGSEALALGYFFDPSTSPVGSWYDLGIFFSVTYFIALSALTFGSFPSSMKTILGVVVGVSLLFVGISGLGDLIFLLGLVTLAFLIVSFISQRSRSVIPGAVSVVALLLLMILSGPLANGVQTMAGFSYAEVKPSWQSTQNMLKTSFGDAKNLVIGKGPNTFTNHWQENRDQLVINDNTWWPIDFPFASGLIPTFAITFGLVTALLMIAFTGYLGVKIFVAMRDDSTDPLLATIGIASGTSALFLWVLSFFHVFSVVPFLLMFILSGIAMSAFSRAGQVGSIEISGGARSVNLASIFGIVVCVALIAPAVIVGVSRSLYGQALVTAQRAEDIQTIALAQQKMRQASVLERNDYFARIETELGLLRLQEFISREDLDESDQGESAQIVTEIEEAASRAVNYNNHNYLNFVNIGLIYETLGLLQVEGGYEAAATSYANAQLVNPTNPAIPLMRARLEILREDKEKAIELAEEALAIKKNYADAYLFLADVALAEENIDGAVATLENSIKAEKEISEKQGQRYIANPFVHFQLGLISYAEKNYTKAREFFSSAISSFPDYANARYFRALTNIYGDLDQKEALRDLEKIAETNPENEVLKSVIANVKAGKDPLEGIEIEEDKVVEDTVTPPTSNTDAVKELEKESDPSSHKPTVNTEPAETEE